MKQINLIPKKNTQQHQLIVHPFWREFAVTCVVGVGLALGLSWILQWPVQALENQLQQTEQLAETLSNEIDRFKELTEERSQLKEQLTSPLSARNGKASAMLADKPLASELLTTLTNAMPYEVWLQTIKCDYINRTIYIEGYAVSKTSMQSFINDKLIHLPYFSDPLIENVRMLEEKNQVEFSFTCQNIHSRVEKKPKEEK